MTTHISRRSALAALAAAGVAPLVGVAPAAVEASEVEAQGGRQKPRRERWSEQTIFASGPGSAPAELNNPHRMSVTSNGLKVLIADTDNNRVTVWTRPSLNANEITDWTVQTTFGCEPSDGDARFVLPQGVAVSGNGLTAWVADTGNARVSQWEYNSGSWQVSETIDFDNESNPYFVEPIDVVMTADNRTIFVLDGETCEVSVFGLFGGNWELITRFGSEGSGQGQFLMPFGLSITADGKWVFVADAYNHRISVWEVVEGAIPLSQPRGLFGVPNQIQMGTVWVPKTRFGVPGTGRGQFSYPAGVANSSNGKKVFVSDWDNNRISVWRKRKNGWKQWYTLGMPLNQALIDVAVTPEAQTMFVPVRNTISLEANQVQVFIGQPTRRRRRWRVYHGRRKPGLH